jgi:hypothetical protein
MCEVRDELVALEDLRADRDVEHRILSAGTVRKTAAANAPAPGAELLVRAESGQVAPSWIGDDHDVATVAAVSPVGAASRHVLLAPEVDRAVTATARDGRQARAVVEHELLRVDD